MGARGPAPKRIEERLGHVTKAQLAGVTKVKRAGVVRVPRLPGPKSEEGQRIHAVARRWYNALAQSGQTDYYEPSDWEAARYVVEAISRNLNDQRFSAQLFGVVWGAMDDLLTTESSRRRARIEVSRAMVEVPQPKPVSIADRRRELEE